MAPECRGRTKSVFVAFECIGRTKSVFVAFECIGRTKSVFVAFECMGTTKSQPLWHSSVWEELSRSCCVHGKNYVAVFVALGRTKSQSLWPWDELSSFLPFCVCVCVWRMSAWEELSRSLCGHGKN